MRCASYDITCYVCYMFHNKEIKNILKEFRVMSINAFIVTINIGII